VKRPAFLFSVDKHDAPVSEHPGLSQLKSENRDKPALLGPFDHLRYDLRSRDAPEVLDDWLYSDAPQLSVHIVAFEDATFVTVSFLHTLMDAMGFSALLKGWTAALRGKEDEIPPIVGLDDDPLAKIHQMAPASEYILADKVLKGWGFFLFVIKYVFDLIWYRKDEERVIFMPAKYLKELRDSALAELSEQSSNTDDTKETPFVSESDVLVSWWTRIMCKALDLSPKRPLTVMNVFDIRGILAEMGSIGSADTAMIANVVWPTVILTNVGDVLGKPMSYLASRVRHAIDTHRVKEQVQAMAAIQKTTMEKSGHPAVFGDPGTFLLTCSNWHRGKLFQKDFSPAVIKEGTPSSERSNPRGKPSFIFISGKFVDFSPRNAFVVMGKDAAGNFWMDSSIRAELWGRIEKLL
jgi:Transferase family